MSLRSEAEYYGAAALIARQLGLPAAPQTIASWTHGWGLQATRLPLIQYAFGYFGHDYVGRPHLVATDDEAAHLQAAGLERVSAVGMPFVYAADIPVDREPGSLLVMPPHSQPYTDHSWDGDAYAQMIASLRPRFSRVVACISRSCVQKGYWTGSFEKVGIPWIAGAWIGDANALTRMATLFRSFEYVSTNAFGSHIPYAAYCGCRVSVYGAFAEYRPEDFRNEQFYVQNPGLLPQVLEYYGETRLRARHPELFVTPWDAEPRQEWAARALGAQFRKPPEEVARLMDWPGFNCSDTRALQLEVCRRQVVQEASELALAAKERQIGRLGEQLDIVRQQLERLEGHFVVKSLLRLRRGLRALRVGSRARTKTD